jgi:hypothetical protein
VTPATRVLADTAATETAWATIVLAVVGGLAFISSTVLAWLTWQSLRFQREQAAGTRRRALPRLRPQRPRPALNGNTADVDVQYVHGTDVALWA